MKARYLALTLLLGGLSLPLMMGTASNPPEDDTVYPVTELRVQHDTIRNLYLPLERKAWKDTDSPLASDGQAGWKVQPVSPTESTIAKEPIAAPRQNSRKMHPLHKAFAWKQERSFRLLSHARSSLGKRTIAPPWQK